MTATKNAISLVDSVSGRIVDLVRASHLDRLPTERFMSAQFGVSRGVIREATKRLELQGLLEIRQGSGMKVVDKLHKPLSSAVHLRVPDEKTRLVQLTEVRLALEPEQARLAAERATKTDLKRLQDCHQRFTLCEDLESQVLADMEFHCLIADASRNEVSSLLMQSLSDLLQSSLSHGYRRVTKDLAVDDHGKVLAAILSRNGAAAAKAMRDHLTHARFDLGLHPKPRRTANA